MQMKNKIGKKESSEQVIYCFPCSPLKYCPRNSTRWEIVTLSFSFVICEPFRKLNVFLSASEVAFALLLHSVHYWSMSTTTAAVFVCLSALYLHLHLFLPPPTISRTVVVVVLGAMSNFFFIFIFLADFKLSLRCEKGERRMQLHSANCFVPLLGAIIQKYTVFLFVNLRLFIYLCLVLMCTGI